MQRHFARVVTFLIVTFYDARAIVEAKSLKHNIELNDRPIIGIQAQTTYMNSSTCGSYIPASYVKYLESAGARVVPVFNNLTEDQVIELFSQLNGYFLPGGGIDVFNSGYGTNAKIFMRESINAFEKEGDYFPIWGTCMGFQTLAMLVVGSDSIMSKCQGVDFSRPLEFYKGYSDSKLFGQAPKNIIKYLSLLNVTYNHHRNCVAIETYDKVEQLHDFFQVLSVNKGLGGKTFVSTFEAKKYPIYGVQWHPEKNPFEFPTGEKGIVHTAESVLVTQYMANFFVNEARKNMHKFKSPEAERAALIYNFNPFYSGISKFENYEQIYCFP